MLNKQALVDYLEKRAREEPLPEPPMLVRYALYQGLADRIRRGDFDYEVREDPDLQMETEDQDG